MNKHHIKIINTKPSLSKEMQVLKITGFYTYNPTFWTKTRRFTVLAVSFSMAIFHLLYLKESLDDIVKFAECLLYINSIICFFLKSGFFLANSNKLKDLEDYLSNPILYKFTKENNEIMTETTNSKFLDSCRILAISFSSMVSIIALNFRNREPVMPIKVFGNMEDIRVFLFYGLYQSLYIFCIAMNSLMMDALCCRYINICIGTLKILKAKLRRIPYEKGSRWELVEYWKGVVVYHNEILKFVNVVEEVFNKTVFSLFVGSVLIFCITIFLITQVDLDPFQLIYFFLFFSCCTNEMLIYCWYGQEIMNESDKIGQELYMTEWYKADPAIKKYLLISMERCRKPIVLQAGKLLPMNLGTVTQISRASYSCFALLSRIYKPDN